MTTLVRVVSLERGGHITLGELDPIRTGYRARARRASESILVARSR
jgi:hypothetical protein